MYVCSIQNGRFSQSNEMSLQDIHTFAAHLCDVPSLQGRLGAATPGPGILMEDSIADHCCRFQPMIGAWAQAGNKV